MRGLPDDPHTGSPRDVLARIEAERRGTPFLVYRDGDDRQQLVDLEAAPSRLSVGRQPDCDVALQWDGQASRLHADLERIAGDWTIVDDGRSRNGTFLNGERLLGRRRLTDRDVVEIGRTLLVFRSPAPGRAWQTTRAASDSTPVISPGQMRVLVALCRPLVSSSSFASPASNREIADELVISGDTVKGHMRILFEAFGIGDVPQNQKRAVLARKAIEHGVVTRHDLERPLSALAHAEDG